MIPAVNNLEGEVNNMKSSKSKMVPYVIAGSAVGGVVGYLFMTESGRQVRRNINPSQLPQKIDSARGFIESKSRTLTNQIRTVLDRAKESVQVGQDAYQQASESYRSNLRTFKGKNMGIAANVHQTVDKLAGTADTVEENLLDPLYEVGALYRAVERGIRSFFNRQSSVPQSTVAPMYTNERIMG
jgi:gas vesicle protein